MIVDIPLYRIERVYLITQTLGSWYEGEVSNVVLVKTMELPWRENKRSISCIPEATYMAVKEAWTVKHPYPHVRILNVPGRSGILAHRITYVKHLLGCIGVGKSFADHNKDGVPDMAQSTIALQQLYNMLPDIFQLKIMENPRFAKLKTKHNT